MLSLDIVYPFWEDLGLRLQRPERVRNTLREALDRHADPTPMLRTDEAAEIDRWIGDAFLGDPTDRDDLFAWHMLIGRVRRDPGRWNELFQGLPGWVADTAGQCLRDAFDLDDIDRRMDGLDGRPLSSWDKGFFADEVPMEGDDPHDRVRDMIGNLRLEESLRRLGLELGPAIREQFLANAERVKGELGGLDSLPPLSWPSP